MQYELNQIGKKFKKLIKSLDEKTLKETLSYSAEPLVQALRQGAPQSRYKHHRYSTPKLVKKLRAPNGKGVRVATYGPGNLKRSMKKLALRRMKKGIMIGPKFAKRGSATGVFNNSVRVDGYYAHFVEKGTSKQSGQGFIKSATDRTRGVVLSRLEKSFEKLLVREIKKLGFESRQ